MKESGTILGNTIETNIGTMRAGDGWGHIGNPVCLPSTIHEGPRSQVLCLTIIVIWFRGNEEMFQRNGCLQAAANT